ncbi:MAG: nickel-responsive transcriptional regulator NikR [Staphylothermus sp.]|nr:nickel-responsive transcriptional regulator NikR [Staphylothermus sp.]
MTKSIKFGVYVPGDLARELEELSKQLGITSRSKIIQEALQLFISEHKWRIEGRVVGVIMIIYNHDVGNVDEKLTDIQHKYIEEIISSLHVHLSKDKCLQVIVVKGDSSKIRNFVNELMNVKGVLAVRTSLLGEPV